MIQMQHNMKTQPIRDQILVHPFPPDEVSVGGIIVPETARERSCKATVVAVGGGTKDRPMRYSEGDIVFHVKDAGVEIIEGGVAFYLMSQVDVLARLQEDISNPWCLRLVNGKYK